MKLKRILLYICKYIALKYKLKQYLLNKSKGKKYLMKQIK